MFFRALTPRPRTRRAPAFLLAVPLMTAPLAGCTAVAQDVRDYYRQMEVNYKEAKEKANVEVLTLEGESKVLATTGEFQKYRRAKREVERLKSWEDRCAKQEERFQKAAVWTEDHFHLDRPHSAQQPAAPHAGETGAASESSEKKDPASPVSN
jgi:hypothetical protein